MRIFPLFFFILFFTAACSSSQRNVSEPPAILGFITDYGSKDDAAALLEVAALKINPSLKVVHITHEIPPFDVWAGAQMLAQTLPYWPESAVLVAVIDPGVGTERKAIAVKLQSGQVLILPDNGLITFIAEQQPIMEARELDDTKFRSNIGRKTFDGRDLFANAGALLAARNISFTDLGKSVEVQSLQRLAYTKPSLTPENITGSITLIDPNFGNVFTNIPETLVIASGITQGGIARVVITQQGVAGPLFSAEVPFVSTFGDVAEQKPLLYINSRGFVSLALNMGSFAALYHISYGSEWSVQIYRINK